MNKKDLTERDICTKFITPALAAAGRDIHTQIREEVSFTKGRIIVRGKLVTRGKPKRADYILYFKPNIPIALIEAKDNNHAVGDCALSSPTNAASSRKVNALMALCDPLEGQLTTSQTESRRLLEAVLQEALATQDSSVPEITS